MIVAPGNIKPSLCKPVIEPEFKYMSKFIKTKITNSMNGINFESKSLIISCKQYHCCQIVAKSKVFQDYCCKQMFI